MSSHILVVRPLGFIRLLSARGGAEGERRVGGGRFLPHTCLQTVHLGSDGRTSSALTWPRTLPNGPRPPVANAEDGGVATESLGVFLAWGIESLSFCSRKTDRLTKRKMESTCPRMRECVGKRAAAPCNKQMQIKSRSHSRGEGGGS